MSGYVGIQTRPDIPSVGGIVTSMTMNFESTRIAIGASSHTTNTGIVKVYDYVAVTNTWVQVGQDLVGSGQNAYFGVSMDMDWDGNRMIVGAWGSKTVHVYDYVAATNTWTSAVVISKPSDTEFGFSVSIEKDTGIIIAASAPGVNNVYVYQLIDGTWTQVFVNNGNDIENIVPETLTSNLVVKSEYSRYGHSIRLSSFGDYLVIGQPGTVLETLNTDNLVNYTGIPISVSSKQESSGVYVDTFGDNQNRQQGSVRVYKSNGSWTTAEQVGSLVRGDIENIINSDARTDFGIGWSFPGFGMSVDISAEGDFIVVGAPLHSVTGGDYTYHNGQLYTFTLQSGEWVKTDVVTGLKRVMFGSSIKLDYTGNRITVTGTNKICSLLNVSDWNGNNWFSAQPDIVINIGTVEPNVTYMSNGTIVPISRGVITLFYDYLLTQSILGNNLVSGYLAADELFIGANDNDNIETQKFSKTKRISFGGTYLDNTYEGATIENRMYQRFISSADGGQGGPGNEGRSELYIAKTSEQISVSESGGVDFIRLKAHEIHLDSYSLYDDLIYKYKQDPTFVLNYQKNIGIGLPFLLDNTGAERYFRGTCDARAKLDVNGSSYIRNRLNVNVSGGNDILGNAGEQPALFLDTRNESSVVGDRMYSNTMVNSRIVNSYITFSGASYSLHERAIFLSSTNDLASAPPPIQGGESGKIIRLSCWIKLITAATVDGIVIQYGETSTSSAVNRVTVSTTTTGIKINYAGSYIVSYDYTFELDTWYHLFLITPGISSINPVSVEFYINAIKQTPTSTNGTTPPTTWNITPPKLMIGTFWLDSAINTYVGMIMFWPVYEARAPSVTQLYNNGPPTEMLTVGGDAVVSNKLAIGSTNPTEALEVTGNVVVSGSTSIGSDGRLHIVSSPSAFGTETMMLQTSIDNRSVDAAFDPSEVDRHVLSLQPNFGRVGIGTKNPTALLDVNGMLKATSLSGDGSGITALNAGNFSAGTLPVARGGTGVTTSTGTGNVVLSASPLLTGSLGYNGGDGTLRTSVDNPGYGTGSETVTLQTSIDGLIPPAGVFDSIRFALSLQPDAGFVGIRTITPQYRLDVNGNLRCIGIETNSDARIKKNILDIDDGAALDILRLIKPKTYEYIDVTERTSDTVYGFIAQEVREVLPYAVNLTRDPIPDIFKNVTVLNTDTLVIDTSGLTTNTRLFIQEYTTSGKLSGYMVKITEIIDSNSLKIDRAIDTEEVFLYGRVVEDFHAVKKDVIWTVATAALQEVDRQLQAEKAKVATLEAQMIEVLARLDALTS